MSAPIDDARLAEMQARAMEPIPSFSAAGEPSWWVKKREDTLAAIAEVKRLRDGIAVLHCADAEDSIRCRSCDEPFPCATAALIA